MAQNIAEWAQSSTSLHDHLTTAAQDFADIDVLQIISINLTAWC
jgi:hypothetical protein